MRRLLAPSLASALLAAAVGLSGCCFSNPFAVAALEDRESQLRAEVRDLEKAVAERRKRSLPALQATLPSKSGFAVQNLSAQDRSAQKLTLRWQSRHARTTLYGQLVADDEVRPEASGTVRVSQRKGRR